MNNYVVPEPVRQQAMEKVSKELTQRGVAAANTAQAQLAATQRVRIVRLAQGVGTLIESQANAIRTAMWSIRFEELDECIWSRETAKLRAAAQSDAAEFNRNLYLANLSHSLELLISIDDHVRLFVRSLTAEAPPRLAHLTVARAALESILKLCYIWDPTIDLSDRLLRIAAFSIGSAVASATGAADLEDGLNLVERTRSGLADLIGLAESAGYSVLPPNSKPRSVQNTFGKRHNIDFNVTNGARLYLKDYRQGWRLMSGAAHGYSWFLKAMLAGQFDSDDQTGDSYVTATVVLIKAAERLLGTIEQFLGVSMSEQLRDLDKLLQLVLLLGANSNPWRHR